MSRHTHDDESQMAGDKTVHRRHSHIGHLSLKPATVIDHLKTKVKRSRISKTASVDIPDFILTNNTNGNINNNNNNNKQSSQDHHEIVFDKPFTSTRIYPISSLPTSSSIQESTGDNDIEYHDENSML
jgi:hypothetical protein